MATKVKWKSKADQHDYPAAADYLSLVLDPDDVDKVVAALQHADPRSYKAKDLLRASRLPLLPESDPEVMKDLAKIRDGDELSPVLLVRGDARHDLPLVVADGYHRVCASYWTDEDAEIPAQLAGMK